VTGRHRGGRSLRRRLVVAVLAAAVGRGYRGRHRLADAALGVVAAAPVVPIHLLPPQRPSTVSAAGRASVAPWLRVVPSPPQPDPLADTVPHPVVSLFPLPAAATVDPSPATSVAGAEMGVFDLVDAEREQQVTAALAAGADVRPYRARHTA
jgi:hypothetical protein